MATLEEVHSTVKKTVTEIIGVPEESLDAHSTLQELGMDDIQTMGLIAQLEESFGAQCTPKPQDMDSQTVESLTRAVFDAQKADA
ncbi:acyl carrier protein [Streptomyces sp. NPDC004520]|uniref:acyl carrier protein n=1 Tax=Streptomyces sp. NPDC004520 TaxID=3364702 RepID=UPI0036BEAFA1